MFDLDFTFSAKLWCYQAEKAAWYFVTLPEDYGGQIKFTRERRVGFGSVRVDVEVGQTRWKTSLFPYKETGSYILPIKAEVRKKEKLEVDRDVHVHLKVIP